MSTFFTILSCSSGGKKDRPYQKKKTGQLPSSLPMDCTWATEWAAHGNFAMQIRLPITSIYGNSGQLSGPVGSPLLRTMKKWAVQWEVEWTSCPWTALGQRSGLPMGILQCKLGCPLHPYMETVDSSKGTSVGNPLLPDMKKWAAQWAMEWAAPGNFAMLMRLPTTSVYMEMMGSSVSKSVGSPLISSM